MKSARVVQRTLKVVCILGMATYLPSIAWGAEIRTGVEVEFRTFYLRRQQGNFSFQFRESKLFLDTFISERSSALMEFVLKEDTQKPHLDRGYFIWRLQPLETRIKLGQFRIPFGFWDAYTIDRSMVKDSFVGQGTPFAPFKLRKLDVGIEVQSRLGVLQADVAVVNGSSLDRIRDDNNQKDVAARLGYSGAAFALHLNSYFGTAQRRPEAGSAETSATRHVYAIGADFTVTHENLTVSGEVAHIEYGPAHTTGAYLQFYYDLLDLFYGLRFVGKVEYWDPSTSRSDNEILQWILALKQTIVRGTTLQIEYRLHSHETEPRHDGLLLEMELEL